MTRLSARQARKLGILPNPVLVKRKTIAAANQWDAKIISRSPGSCTWIKIPLLPPSLNEWSRWYWAKRDRYLKELSGNVAWLAKYAHLPRFEIATVQVVYYFRDARQRDKDNYNGKFLLDALRYASIIARDDAEVLSLPQPDFRVDRESPHTEIFVWEGK